ncbi:hypothetical protein ABPG72_004187 [Tetrahymena utriculariae]
MSTQTQQQKKQRNMLHICLSSMTSAAITNSILVPLDVIKIRLQKTSMEQKVGKVSFISMLKHIIKQEGVKTLFNGLQYSVYQSVGFNLTMLLVYERLTHFVEHNITSHSYYKPLITSIFSTSISTTLAFPLEYWKTVQQSNEGVSHKKGFQLGNRIYSALIVSIQRNVGFFIFFWPISENVKKYLIQKHYFSELRTYQKGSGSDKQISYLIKNFILNWSAGICGASVAGFLTQPFDILKTRKQINEMYGKQGTLQLMADIVKNEGVSHLFVGLQPRFVKVLVYGSMFFSIYENFLHLCDSHLPF